MLNNAHAKTHVNIARAKKIATTILAGAVAVVAVKEAAKHLPTTKDA